jgi:hypothetical protein
MTTAQRHVTRLRRAARRQRKVGSIQLHSWSVRASLIEAPLIGRSLVDHARELRINALGDLMCAAKTRPLRAVCWRLMRADILARSEAQMSLLEDARGLQA